MKTETPKEAPNRSPRAARRRWPWASTRWWSRRRHVLAGFWQKSAGWAVPRDPTGAGYWDLVRESGAAIGFCVLFMFVSGWGQTFLLSVFQPHWMRSLDLDPADMGMIYGGATLASGLLLPLTGRWLDRASAMRTATITLLGLALFSAVAASVTSVAALAVALFGLRFFGQGLSANVGTVNAARWFTHNRGKALSLAGLGFPLGEATLPLIITLSAAVIGWRFTWWGLAVVCLAVFLPLAVILASRQATTGSPGDEAEESENGSAEDENGSLLRDWRFYAMLGVIAPLPFVTTGVIFFQAMLAEERGWGGATFATGFLAFAVVRGVSSISFGAWVDRVGAMRLLAVPTFTATVGLAFLVRPEPGFAYLFFVGLGLSFGSSGAIITAAWTEMFGDAQIGMIRGLSSSVAIFLTAAAPVCFGLALNAGVPAEVILLTCALSVLLVTWPLSLWLRLSFRRSRAP